MILKQGPNFTDDTAPAVIWEHGRRNFGLRHDGVLAVVLPVTDGSDVCGVGVFTGDRRRDRRADERRSRRGKPRCSPSRCTAALGFPGDSLPVAAGRSREAS